MGRVYLGRTPAGSAVAVKAVHREYAGDRSFRKRFEQEVAAARRVQGLYTVPVVDADLQADEPWLATAYVPGPSLDDAVAESGPLPVDEVLGLIARVAEALQSVHAAGVIHRDLKPSNIILTGEGPKVIDFGIARAADVTSLTGTGMLAGTPAYMAPEYIRGQTVTEAVDVFALGVVASFAASGRPAFGVGSPHSVTYRILEQAPDLDGCPEPVRAVAADCLEKDPRRRPTPAEVVQHCHRAAVARGTGGDGRTVASPPGAGTVVAPAVGFHDAVTSPAPLPTVEDRAGAAASDDGPAGPPGSETPPIPQSADLLAAAAPPLPVLLGTAGVIALAAVLVAVLLPGGSAEPDTPSSREPVATLVDFPHGGGGVAFSPDGEKLAAGGGDGRVLLWDVADRTPRATFTQRDASGDVIGVSCLDFSPDGTLLATCLDMGGVGVWDVARGRQVAGIPLDDHDSVESVAFSPDGTLLATGGDRGVRLWDADSGGDRLEELAVLDSDVGVTQVAFSPDGRTLASTGHSADPPGRDHWVHLWDVAGRTSRSTLHHPEESTDVAFGPDGEMLATAGLENTVRLWDLPEGRRTGTLVDEDFVELDGGLAFSPDGTTLAVVSGTEVRLWDLADREQRTHLVGRGGNLGSVAFSPDGRLLAASRYDGEVQLWEVR